MSYSFEATLWRWTGEVSGGYLLPVKAAVHKSEGLEDNADIEVCPKLE